MKLLSAGVFWVLATLLAVASWANRQRFPDATVSGLFDRLLASRTVRIAVIVAWWWLGWHFLGGETL